jgi:hypothetical protein
MAKYYNSPYSHVIELVEFGTLHDMEKLHVPGDVMWVRITVLTVDISSIP